MIDLPQGKFSIGEENGIPYILLPHGSTPLGSGANGAYHNLENGYGVKLFHHTCSTELYQSSTRTDLAIEEFQVLVKLKDKLGDIAPTPHSVQMVKCDNGRECHYYVGAVVEHIVGKQGDQMFKDYSMTAAISQWLLAKMAALGFMWNDSHAGNWMVTEAGRIVIVDWGGMQYYYQTDTCIQNAVQNYLAASKDYSERVLKDIAIKEEQMKQFAAFKTFIQQITPKETQNNEQRAVNT